MDERRPAEIMHYEHFLKHTLQRDLRNNEKTRMSTREEMSEYKKLEKSLEVLKKHRMEPLRTLVDLGPQVYAQGDVGDTSMLLIDIGIGFHIECTLEEAARVCHLREAFLLEKEHSLLASCASIRANIRLVTEGLGELRKL